jgi:hypothetical protein
MAEVIDLEPTQRELNQKNLKKYTFGFITTSINIILLYLIIRYFIYPIIYTIYH